MNGIQIYLQTLKSRPQADEATRLYAVDCGGSGGDGGFTADAYFTGGSMFSWGTTHDTSGLTDPMPAPYYRSFRFAEGSFSYNFPVSPGNYRVRFHFSSGSDGGFNEPTQAFDVSINGVFYLNDYNPYISGGNTFNRGVIAEIELTATTAIVIDFTTQNIRSICSGIEIYQL